MDEALLDQEIRAFAARYLAGEIGRGDFEAWFVARSWDERTRLAAEIDHLFAEAAFIGDDFNNELRLLVATIRAGSEVFLTGSASLTVSEDRVLALAA
jgi:hypothetical protein